MPRCNPSSMGGAGKQQTYRSFAVTQLSFRAIASLAILCFFLVACQATGDDTDSSHSWLSWFGATPSVTITASPVQNQTKSQTPRVASTPGTGGSKTTPSPVIQRLTTVRPSELKGVTITLLHPWTGPAADGLQSLVDEFNRKNEWEIHVDVASAGSQGEVAAWMVNALNPLPTPTTPGLGESQKALPDLVAAGPIDARTWQGANPIFESIQEYASDPTWGLTEKEASDLQSGKWPGASDVAEYDSAAKPNTAAGSYSAAPAQRSLVFLFYNQSWAKLLGFSQAPTTPDEFRQQACKAAKANQYDPDPQRRGTGGWLVSADSLSMLGWFKAFGGQVGPDAAGSYTFNTPAITQAFTFLKSLESQNCAWTGLDPTPYDYFAKRDALFYLGNLDDLALQRDAMHKANQPDQWTVIPFPAVEGKPMVVSDNLNFYLVKSTPARQMAAWLFIRWMESSEQQARWMKMANTVPLGQSVEAILGGFRKENPQWATAFDLQTNAFSGPDQASWALIGGVLEDGAQQILQPGTPLADIPAILAQMDQTAAELLTRKAP